MMILVCFAMSCSAFPPHGSLTAASCSSRAEDCPKGGQEVLTKLVIISDNFSQSCKRQKRKRLFGDCELTPIAGLVPRYAKCASKLDSSILE